MTNVKADEGVGRHAKTLPVTGTAAMTTEKHNSMRHPKVSDKRYVRQHMVGQNMLRVMATINKATLCDMSVWHNMMDEITLN